MSGSQIDRLLFGALLGCAVAAAILGVLGDYGGSAPTVPAQPPAAGVTPLEEDDPGWDCHTMGNRWCGVTR